MEIGSDEWNKQAADTISREATSLLNHICDIAAEHSKVAGVQLNQIDSMRVASYILEVQHESFMLGLRLAFKFVAAVKETAKA